MARRVPVGYVAVTIPVSGWKHKAPEATFVDGNVAVWRNRCGQEGLGTHASLVSKDKQQNEHEDMTDSMIFPLTEPISTMFLMHLQGLDRWMVC